MKALIVDDEPVQVETLRRGLRTKGYKVVGALSGQEALNMIADDVEGIDLVLTDYSMPGMNGIELAQAIHRDREDLPVIMMTAYGQKDLVIEALRSHCSGFLEKPFAFEEMMREIDRVTAKAIQNAGFRKTRQVLSTQFHQLNNPLACINGSAELAKLRMEDQDAVKKFLNNITAAVKVITGINKRIMEAGRCDVSEFEKVDMNSLINDSLSLFQDVLDLKSIRLEKRMEASESCLRGNKFNLMQMLSNLILNAIDSMEGRPRKLLRINTASDEQSSSIFISIEDSGGGISKESLGKLFTPYFTQKENGTGLGLAVVKSVVEEHSGKIEVESVEGEGAVFRVSLPRLKATL